METSSGNEASLVASGTKQIDGKSIYWEKHGTGHHPVLCLPGLLGYATWCFHPVFRKADMKTFTFIAVDPQGFGKSRPPGREFSGDFNPLRRDGKYAAEVMEILGYKKYSILGWSNGALTGLLMAADFPQAVHRVVACNPVVDLSSFVHEIMKNMCDLKNWPPKDAKIVEEFYGEQYFKQVMTEWTLWLYDGPDKKDIFYPRALMRTIITPILFIHGQRDVFSGESDKKLMREDLRNLIITEVIGGRHSHLDFIDDLVRLTQSFVQEEDISQGN